MAINFYNPITAGTVLVRSAVQSQNYAAGTAGWSIDASGNAEFNNGTFQGTVTAAQIIGSVFGSSTTDPSIWINEDNANSLRVYDASGNLVCEIGAASGTQASAYFYDPTVVGGAAVSIGQQIQWLTGSPVLSEFAALYQKSNGIIFNTQLQGGLAWDTAHAAWVKVVPGTDTFYSWQSPSYAANFATGSTSGTYQGLQFRFDSQDNLHIEGAFHCTASVASGTTIFTLPGTPTTYRPKLARNIRLGSDVSGVPSTGSYLLQINSNGPVKLLASAATSTTQNFYVNAVIPLGNIT